MSTRGFAVSPDGRSVVFADAATGQLYRQNLNQLDATPISGAENVFLPFFSPNGEWVGYFDQEDDALKKIRLDGTAQQTLAAAPPGTFGSAGWASDGTIVFHSSVLGNGDLWMVPDTGGEPERIVDSEGPNLSWIDVLPDGRSVLGTLGDQVALVSLETGERRPLLQGTTPRYVTSGHVIFWREGALWAVPFDLEQLEVTGEALPVIDDVLLTQVTGLAHYAVGGDVLFYRTGAGDQGGIALWLDRDGMEEVLEPPLRGRLMDPAVSPDGRKIAVGYTAGDEPRQDIWVYDLDQGGTFTQLTFEGYNVMPFWSLDSGEVGFSSSRGGSQDLYSRPVDLSDEARLLVSDPDANLFGGGWTPDGRWLVHYGGGGLWYAAPDPDSTAHVLLDGPGTEQHPALSPDGRLLAYVSDESGQQDVYVRSFPPGAEDRRAVSTSGGIMPVWSRSGEEIFYLAPDDQAGWAMWVAEVRADPDFAVESQDRLFAWNPYFMPGGLHPQFDLLPGDQRFVAIRGPQSGEEDHLLVVQNFSEMLRRAGLE